VVSHVVAREVPPRQRAEELGRERGARDGGPQRALVQLVVELTGVFGAGELHDRAQREHLRPWRHRRDRRRRPVILGPGATVLRAARVAVLDDLVRENRAEPAGERFVLLAETFLARRALRIARVEGDAQVPAAEPLAEESLQAHDGGATHRRVPPVDAHAAQQAVDAVGGVLRRVGVDGDAERRRLVATDGISHNPGRGG
jgi:hypothetical protein